MSAIIDGTSASSLSGTLAVTGAVTLTTALPVASGGTVTNASTGTGSVVLATSPTLVTPLLGVATATSINFGGTALSAYAEGTWTPVDSSGANLTFTGTATTGNRTLAQRGVATILCVGTNTFVISGGGLS